MRKKSRRALILSILSLFVLCPLAVFAGIRLFESKNYYVAAALIIVFSLIPFFAFFEKRRIKTSELVTVAVMTAICVVGRAAFVFLPQVKPMCALVVATAAAFGANVGFVTGALSMFVSNFIFGQGMYTPFQMLGMGLVGFFGGLLLYKSERVKSRFFVCVSGALLCFFVYGTLVDTCSVLMLTADFSIKSAIGIYASGAVFNLIHSLTTAAVLFVINKPMNDKLSRLRIKYGIFSHSEVSV